MYKLEETYKTLQKKHIDIIKDWEETNPNWQDCSNKKDEYIEIVQNVMKLACKLFIFPDKSIPQSAEKKIG